MIKELGEFTGKTIEEAIKEASITTGIEEKDLEYEILKEGKKGGLFGIGAEKASIRVYHTETDGERAVEFLKGILEKLSIEAQPRLVREEEKIEIEIETENKFEVVGKKGVILDALQNLAGAAANIGREEYKRVVVDCQNYRQKREETLKKVAKKTAEKAVKQGRKVRLEPMSAYERRIIHSTLADSTEVTTMSEGKEPRRFVVIVPNEIKPYTHAPRKERWDSGRNSTGKGSRGGFNRDKNRGEYQYNRERKNEGDRTEGGSRDRNRNYRGDRSGNYNRNSNRGNDRRNGSVDNKKEYTKRPYRQYTEEEKAERSKVSGGTGMNRSYSSEGNSSYKKNSTMVFGTYLGNSKKNEENKEE